MLSKEGTPIWDSEMGATSIATLTLIAGHIYEFWVQCSDTNMIKITFSYKSVSVTGGLFSYIYHGATSYEAVVLYAQSNISIVTIGFSGELESIVPLIYKVIDMGVLNLNEVA